MDCLHLRSALVCSLALALSSAGCDTSESTIAIGDNSAEQIMGWVEANRTKLPTDYDELGRLPMPYRRVVFGLLPPATRSALFQTQFERYATEHPDMNAEQRAALQKGRELFTPELYAAPPESPDRQAPERAPLAAFQQQAFAAFGRELTIQLFATIGPEDPANP